VAAVGFLIEIGGIWLGLELRPGPDAAWFGANGWMGTLLAYAFIASVLPVWALLQARDFLNSLLLYLGMGLAYVGFFALGPTFAAPAVVLHPPGAPPLLPFVFITIACGAASGFHALVSSGTTAKQLSNEAHARPIGYGAMIGESLLGLLATLACTAGFASSDLWHGHYSSWNAAHGLSPKIDAFIKGTTHFVTTLGIPHELAAALIAMVVVSFALTTLDSATRLLRFNIEEIGASFKIPLTPNRHLSSPLACGAIALFAFYRIDGRPAGIALWQLFGTTNQLLAGLTLTLASLYLHRKRWPVWPTAIPAIFMMASTLSAMAINLVAFAPGGKQADTLLLVVGGLVFLLGCWLVVETFLVLLPRRKAAAR